MCLIYLALITTLLNLPYLFGIYFILAVWALLSDAGTYYRIIKRVRWLLLILLVVYAFSVPGEFVAWIPLDHPPSYEGMVAGSMQSLRILVVLTGLALILMATTKEELIGAFYQLLVNLNLPRGSADRIAIRLWLTLHYVERHSGLARKDRTGNFLDMMLNVEEENNHILDEIKIPINPWMMRDTVILVVISILFFIAYYEALDALGIRY